MARGDLTLFNELTIYLGEEIIDLENDTLKLGLINNTHTPLVTEANAQWTTGTSANYYQQWEVNATVGDYPANGYVITNNDYTRSGAVATLDADDVAIGQNAGGFTDGYWGILYSDSATSPTGGDAAIAFIDLDGAVSQQAGPININWHTNGILTMTRT